MHRRPRTEEQQDWQKFLGSVAWQKNRKMFLAAYPLCERHRMQGRLVPAVHVHHLAGKDEDKRLDWDYLAGLCRSCHTSVTKVEESGGKTELPDRIDRGDGFQYA